MKIERIKKNALNVVVASNGYPGKFIINQILPSLKNAKEIKDITIYHSGTNIDKNRNLINSGGRVLSLTSVGNTFEMCREKAYSAVQLINWQGGFYRDDIGKSKKFTLVSEKNLLINIHIFLQIYLHTLLGTFFESSLFEYFFLQLHSIVF